MRSDRRKIAWTTLCCAALAATAAAQTGGDPLRLALECKQSTELTLRFTIQNVSMLPSAAIIGSILGNDQNYLPDRLELTVRRARRPDISLEYVLLGIVGGQIGP